ncbi:EAL domain-containing protein [Parapusillimonas sp. SGNA-6]|nr:EAL domain-containing protein [Parapusillimonas sp. SGNA-6]
MITLEDTYPVGWVLTGLALLLAVALGVAALLKVQVARRTRDLMASEERLNTILDGVDAHIYIKDRNLTYRYGNRKVRDFFGVAMPELVGRRDTDFFDAATCEVLREHDLRVLEDGQRVAEEETCPQPGTGRYETCLTIKIPLRGEDGEVEALCGISTDITQHKATQEAAHRLAFYDPLTGLPNRRLLLERMDHAVDAIKHGAGIGAVLFIDLDNFKRINDARGHKVGDALLCSAAHRLGNMVRAEDTVAHIGGDEFVILLDHLGRTPEDSARVAMMTADAVREALEEPFVIDGEAYLSGGSVGVTLLRDSDRSSEDMLREADTAMHRSKEAGRNCVAFYETSMQRDVEERLSLERDLAEAIGTPQIQMHLQPQYDAAGQVVGAEMLIRWKHPERGQVPPSRFIPVAEETGLILRIGDWTLQQACATLLKMQRAGATYPLSVNVSPRQFRQPDFVSRVHEILKESGAPGECLIFEITEGVLIEDVQGAIDRMTELVRLGIRFSIDDFGTGYSSLAYLKRLPLYELKIDRTFIQDTPGDPDNTAIVHLILSMARQLSLRVVAEGVETQEQADFLKQHGCDALQGFLLDRPMPIEDWLAREASIR